MVYSENWNGYVAFKAQSAKGSQASGSDAQILWTSGGQGGLLTKASVESQIVRHDGQQLRGRHGTRRTAGTYNSEMAMGRADPILEAIMRSSWSAANLELDETDFTSITTGANTIVFASGSPISLGLRVHDVIRLTNHATAGNNNRNLRITGLTSTTITVAETLTVNAVADTECEITRPGRVLINGAAGALSRTYFTVEEHEFDLDASELFTDCRWSRFMLRMAPDGNLDCEFGWTGTGESEVVSSGSAPHFTSPTDPTGVSLAATDATIRLGSSDIVDLTAFDFTLDTVPVAPAVIGNGGISPDVLLGTTRINMNITLLRKDLQALADFDAETALSLHLLGSENEAAPADFFSLAVPNFTLGGVAKSALSKAGGARTVQLSIPAELVGKDERGGAFSPTMAQIQISNAT